jgi:hypothetical protein
MAKPIFYLHIQSQGCTGGIWLNDAPMFAVGREEAQRALPTISEWVVNGENVLTVQISEVGEDPRIRVALCEAELGDVPEPGREVELIVIEWPPMVVDVDVEVEVELPGLPLVLSDAGVATHPWGQWAWEDAPPFDPDSRTTAAVIGYVRELHATLAAGSVDRLIAESQFKFREVAPAYELSAADAELRIRQAWEGLTGHADWELAAFDEGDLDLRLHCGGRLVEPTTLEGAPVIRQAVAIEGEVWSLSIFIGRTHWGQLVGELAIFR